MALYHIVAAEPVGAGVLRVTFATGEVRRFDVRPFLRSAYFERLADPATFAQVRVEAGTITWPEGHDFDPGTVYARSEPDAAGRAA